MQSISTIALKIVKISKLVEKKLMPYRSIIGLVALRKIKYSANIPGQLFYVYGFDHKVTIPQKHIFAVLLIHSIDPTGGKTSKLIENER